MLGNFAFEWVFFKLGRMEHFPGAWGHFSVWSSLFLPPATPPPIMLQSPRESLLFFQHSKKFPSQGLCILKPLPGTLSS